MSTQNKFAAEVFLRNRTGGMEALWVLMLHSITTMMIYFLSQSGAATSELIYLHGLLYMILFVSTRQIDEKNERAH